MEINGYPDYLVYEDGRVFSKRRRKMLKPHPNPKGYHHIRLCKDGNIKNFSVHRLVALHYIPNPENKPQVDHIDRNKLNNHVSNLRWATQSDNQQNTIVRKTNKTTGIKNISYHKIYGHYHYQKKIRGEYHSKYFKTLEEAIAYKEEFESQKQLA